MKEHLCFGCMGLTCDAVCKDCGWSHSANNGPTQIPVGTRLRDRYVVGRVLDQDAAAVTYLCWDEGSGNSVVIREHFPAELASRERSWHPQVRCTGDWGAFESEKRRFLETSSMLSGLTGCEALPKPVDSFEENDTAYRVSERPEGKTLSAYVRKNGGKLGRREVGMLLRPVAEALQEAHALGLIHGGICPDRIIVGPGPKVKLLDLGAEPAPVSGYAAAEQDGSGELGPWTDVYGLCAVIYFCLTGTAPEEPYARTSDIGRSLPEMPGEHADTLRRGLDERAGHRGVTLEDLCDTVLRRSAIFITPVDPVRASRPAGPVPLLIPPVPEEEPKPFIKLPDLPREPEAAEGPWICPNDETVNEGPVCIICGAPRPAKAAEPAWKGTKPEGPGKRPGGITIVPPSEEKDPKATKEKEPDRPTTKPVTVPGNALSGRGGIRSGRRGKLITAVAVVLALVLVICFTLPNGWGKDDLGRYRYYTMGFPQREKWVQEAEGWYYLDDTGYMATGWRTIGSETYYFGTDGVMVTGWRYIRGGAYYFGTDGIMYTGYRTVDGNEYYFGADGRRR